MTVDERCTQLLRVDNSRKPPGPAWFRESLQVNYRQDLHRCAEQRRVNWYFDISHSCGSRLSALPPSHHFLSAPAKIISQTVVAQELQQTVPAFV